MRRCVALALALLGSVPVALAAQPYPGVTPRPRSTDPAAMRASAVAREIVERIRIGVEAEGRRDWDGAAAEFERALELHPGEPQASTAFYDLGIAQAGLGDDAAAAVAFREAVARDPGFLAARANLVAVEIEKGDLKAARSAADELVKLAPDSARALYSRGLVALRTGDAATALGDFGKLLAGDPSYAVAHYDLALAETQAQRFGEAERELRAALELAPGYDRARLALGAILLREGKRAEARATFDQTARKTNDPALRNLAGALRDAIAAAP